MRILATCFLLLAASACSNAELLSPRSGWGADLTDRSPPTKACPGGTVEQLATRMDVSSPYALADFEPEISDRIRTRIASDHRLYSVRFGTDPDADGYWGFSGYLVARGDCIVHAEVTSYDN